MPPRGIKLNYDQAGPSYVGAVFAGANRFNFATEDITVCGWMNIRGDKPGTSSSSIGHAFAYLLGASGTRYVGLRAVDADNRTQHSPWTETLEYNTDALVQANASTTTDVVATDQNYFYAFTWNNTTASLVLYYAIDGGSLTGGGLASSLAITDVKDTIRFGAKIASTEGANVEITNVKVWKRLLSPNELDAERMSSSVANATGLYAHWTFLNASDLTSANPVIRVLSATGTITDGTMNPSDIVRSPINIRLSGH